MGVLIQMEIKEETVEDIPEIQFTPGSRKIPGVETPVQDFRVRLTQNLPITENTQNCYSSTNTIFKERR